MGKRRKQGEGTLRLRKDGRWEGRVVVGYDDNGLPITKNVTAKTKTECAEKLKALKNKYSQPIDKINFEITFGEWINFWYRTYCKHTIRVTTQIEYENRIYKHIIPEIGSIPLKQLTQSDLQQFYAREKVNGRKIRTDIYGAELSDRVIRAIHANCRSALERAVQDGLIKTNPAIGCKLPPKKSCKMKVLTQNEIVRFLNQAKEEEYYELFLLELGTGMRRGEILALKWSDLNFKTGELRIERQLNVIKGESIISESKTKSSIRTAILPTALLKILSEYKKNVESEWIFPSPLDDTKPRNPSAVRKRLQLILERAGCPNVRFHDLRHTFATIALEKGMDIKTLSATLGHISSETTIDIYSHITNKMRQQAAVRIDRQIGGTNEKFEPIEKQTRKDTTQPDFEPYKPKIRKSGTGCVTMINGHLFEGRYSPKSAYGKRESHNIYAKTREECEEKLSAMIAQVKAEITAEKKRMKSMKES
ncbi:MAG: site-specific integrase [Firmicutes bacterium]|nr:site-specific integrase [[Eubacterium] siraeum]MCM1488395.1 site-specific integrase [Bacillota bacterium]